MYKIIIVFVLVFIFKNLQSQNIAKDTIHINEVEVLASRLNNYSIGGNVQKIDKITIKKFENQNISDLLSKQTSVIINSYGIGGLSTPTVRGGGSSHTAVIWNGLNLQNPLSGGVNLSLMPVYMFDNIEIQYGGSGTIYGSGNISGAIHLNNENILNAEKNTTIFVSYGSFNNKIVGFTSKFGNKNISNSIKLFSQLSQNDFKYLNTAKINNPTEYQTNAELNQIGINNDTELKITKNSNLKLSIWLQNYDKNLQTLMTDSDPSKANQKDKTARTLINFKTLYKKCSLNFRSGLLYDNLIYKNPKFSTESSISSYSFVNEFENKFFIANNQTLNSGLNFTHEIGESSGLPENISRNRFSIFSNYKLNLLKNKLVSVASFRVEMVEKTIIPIVYNFGTEYNLNIVKIKASFAKSYRLPTFNELYWNPDVFASGNINLKSESGISGNFSLEKQVLHKNFNFSINGNIFISDISNWIIWLPDEKGKWTPQNIKNGTNSGFELSVKSNLKHQKSNFNFTGNYAFTKPISNQNSSNNVLLYIPKHKINCTLSYSYKNFNIDYTHNYFSERYYDYSHFLEMYFIEDISLGYNSKIDKNNVSISFKIGNIFNTKYQVIAWYAMPLRNYLITLKYKFN